MRLIGMDVPRDFCEVAIFENGSTRSVGQVLPGIWRCDEQTRVRRRMVTRRTQLVRGRTRAKNQIHAALIRQIEGRAPGRDVLGKKGRAWLATLELPADERSTVASCLREADFLSGEIAAIDRDLAQEALGDPQVRRLMTIPGVDMVTAVTLMSCIGAASRFPTPRHMVGYVRLDPRIRKSGVSAARHGHISRQGSAAARELTTLAWHVLTRQQDYIYERPALTHRKLRKLEMTTGSPPRSNPGGRHGPGTPDNPAPRQPRPMGPRTRERPDRRSRLPRPRGQVD